MSQYDVHSGIAPHAWLKHHLPWLGLLAVVLGMFREAPILGVEPDQRNG